MDEQKLLKRKKKAISENNQTLLASTCASLAKLYMNEARHNLAMDEFKIVADIYKSQNKPMEYGQAHRGIGEAYMGVLNFEKALEHQQIYLDVANEQNNKVEQQRAFATIGHIYLTWYLETQSDPEKNLASAYKYFMKSLMIAERLSEINKSERMDMIGRLMSNLGLVKECKGEYKKALKLFNTSIDICKKNDCHEQLTRGYLSVASLYEKRMQYNDAIQCYNLAIDSAKLLKDSADLMCAVLLAKSEALVKLADFHSARRVLLKAYKLNTPNMRDKRTIERNLKIVALMCRTEGELVMTNDNLKERKKLYETMGDGACELKNYGKALEYYKLMLKCAEESGASGRELGSCYYSLAETYKDNGQFAEAVEYFEKEYELCASLKDNLNTLSKIADTKEAAGTAVTEVKAVYDRAFRNCRQCRNLKEERRMVSRCITYLRRNDAHSDAFQLTQYLATLGDSSFEEESSSSECESEDSEAKANIGDDVNLDDITDDSDDSDAENKDSSTGKRRNRNYVLKKNAKGETQLHTACIGGNMPVVRHFVEQGHPVNVRDNSGWLPLHEACNHGHEEVVRYLLDKGAAINDRGGTHCNGITPLYDAANNGHLRVVQLLLDRGASVTIKNDEGNTPLSVLKEWHKANPLKGEDLTLYHSLVKRMSEAIEKAGQSSQPTGLQTCDSPLQFDWSDDDLYESYCLEETDTPRSRPSVSPAQKKSPASAKRSAVVDVDEDLNDWLEEDVHLSKVTKRRKVNHVAELLVPHARSGGSRTQKTQSSPKKSICDNIITSDIFFGDNSEDDSPIVEVPSPLRRERRVSEGSTSSTGSAKRKQQTSLLDIGFKKVLSNVLPSSAPNRGGQRASSSIRRTNSFEHRPRSQQGKLTNLGLTRSVVEADSTTPVSSQSRISDQNSLVQGWTPPVCDPMAFVDVKIEGMAFRVPVLLTQVQTNTIGWLAEQAAAKYARKHYTRPTLELETTTGALLSDDDPLSLLFPLGATQAEPVVGRVMKLNVPPMIERYKEACGLMGTDVEASLCAVLEEVSVSLNVADGGFLSTELSPLCKALNHQAVLQELDLSGNFLDSGSVSKLCSSLPSLVNLSALNLRCTGLTSDHLSEFVGVLTSSSEPVLQKLADLNLSDNHLRDKSLAPLSRITRHVTLRSLGLSNVKFTRDLFGDGNRDVSLNLREIRQLDVSDNRMGSSDISKLVSWTTVSKLVTLDVSRNCPDNEGVLGNVTVELLAEEDARFELKALNLSRCNVTENELYEFLRLSPKLSLSEVNLSYNPRLTGISLRRLLECSSLEKIDLLGCQDVLRYFDDCGGCDLLDGRGEKTVKMSPNLESYPEEAGTLIDAFKRKYPGCYVERGRHFLLLSSREPNKRW